MFEKVAIFPNKIVMGTALPASAVDGDQFILVDSTTAPTYAWLLQYVAAKSSNKWQFIGGSQISAEVGIGETTASTSYAALTTAGPSIAIPVAGDYYVAVGYMNNTQATAQGLGYMSYDIGGTGASDNDAANSLSLSTTQAELVNAFRRRKKTGLTAVTLTAKYKTTAGTHGFSNRWMEVIPIAIGG